MDSETRARVVAGWRGIGVGGDYDRVLDTDRSDGDHPPLHRLRREMPGKIFLPGPTDQCACSECRFMKMNTLEKAVAALENLAPEVVLAASVMEKARNPIEKMLEWSRN